MYLPSFLFLCFLSPDVLSLKVQGILSRLILVKDTTGRENLEVYSYFHKPMFASYMDFSISFIRRVLLLLTFSFQL